MEYTFNVISKLNGISSLFSENMLLICLCDTWGFQFSSNSVYTAFSTKKAHVRGSGVALYVSKQFAPKLIAEYETSFLCIEIHIRETPLYAISLYINPSDKENQSRNIIAEIRKIQFPHNKNILIAGDFNGTLHKFEKSLPYIFDCFNPISWRSIRKNGEVEKN